MSKGEETRQEILAHTVGLFNRQGYAGVSLSQIMEATGLKKGGIYNHFASKEQLALDVFDYAVGKVRERFKEGLTGKKTAGARLHAILAIMARYVTDPPVDGGCPVNNAAVDSLYTFPALQQRARAGMEELQQYIRSTVEKGVARSELQQDLDPDQVAAVMLASLEGALTMSKLYDDPVYMQRAVTHLAAYVDRNVLG